MNPPTRIAITGAGAVCGAGITVDDIWHALVNGQSAVKEISSFDASRWPVRVAAEVTGVDNRTLVEDRKLHKMISKTDLFGRTPHASPSSSPACCHIAKRCRRRPRHNSTTAAECSPDRAAAITTAIMISSRCSPPRRAT